jgi:serine protease AprX
MVSTSAAKPARKPVNTVGPSLMKSVISRPLLDAIERELATTEELKQQYQELAQRYKTIVFLNPEYRGGTAGARVAVRDALARFARRPVGQGGRRRAIPKLDDTIVDHALLGSLKPEAVDYLLGANESLSGPILQIWPSRWDVIIDINLEFRGRPSYQEKGSSRYNTQKQQANPYLDDPRERAKSAIVANIGKAMEALAIRDPCQCVRTLKTKLSNQYVFARLEGRVLLQLVRLDEADADEWSHMAERRLQQQVAPNGVLAPAAGHPAHSIEMPNPRQFRAIHRIWPDFDLHHCTHRSVRTVKADAAQNSFSAFGEGITWAVVDSGIDGRHPHFALHGNIDPTSPFHRDFTKEAGSPLTDEKGHGTHVAGIIAGQQSEELAPPVALVKPYDAAWRLRGVERSLDIKNAAGDSAVEPVDIPLTSIAGIAPKCKLVSLKVLDEFGLGKASSVIAAIAHIQLINGHGRDLKIHGINLSLGHSFDPEWFACGHSPLCVEVNRLVKSGVVVVVAAGNSGYGVLRVEGKDRYSGLDLTINDPGNAELAITVGATHRESPHRYGVSYFSSKGPTGDGRYKPDLIAPGEKIVSAAAAGSVMVAEFAGDDGGPGDVDFAYFESSGTSMAAPHVSGAIAAFLSIRNEFIGEPEKVKDIFVATATDLRRDRYFQGAGVVDLLRAIQSV